VSVHVAFDIYPAATPNGSLLVRLLASGTGTKQAVELSARKVLHGSGEGMIRIHSSHAAATSANFTKRNYVKVVLVNGATETEWFGFFLEQGDFGAISRREQAGRMLTFSGPGSLFYLDRALLLAEIYAPGQPRRGNLELDGQWGWNDIPYGAIMTRAMEEGYYAPGNPLFYATWDFTRTEDSAAVAWPNIDNEFTVPWGTSVYDLIASFIKLGLVVTVDADLTFHAWQTYGTNRTSATFAAGKIRFAHGVNIGNEVTRQIRASLERSHIFVVGDEFTSAVVSGGSSAVTYYDTLQKQETNDSATLTAAGQRDLDQREIQADAAFPVRVILDDDELNGLYVPGEHYDVGDIATIHTVPPSGASGEHDFTNFAIEVAAIKVEHDDAGNWFAVNELGAQYLSAQLSALETPSSKIIHQIELCRPLVSSVPVVLDTDVGVNNAAFLTIPDGLVNGAIFVCLSDRNDAADTTAITYDPDPGSPGPTYALTKVPGSEVNHATVVGPRHEWWYLLDPAPSIDVGGGGVSRTGGTAGNMGAFLLQEVDPASPFSGFTSNSGTSFASSLTLAVSGSQVPLDAANTWTPYDNLTQPDHNPTGNPVPSGTLAWTDMANNIGHAQEIGGSYGDATPTWTFTGDYAPPWLASGLVVNGTASGAGGDGHPDLIGTSIRAKRCDDTEHYHTTGDPTVNDDTSLGFRNGTLWINETSGAMFLLLDNTEGAADWLAVGGAGPDLSGIDFLVGTASGLLSGEIVAGTTPGGELGGTWDSPTVDATHSGSTHSAATDTHIADGTDAHDASAISFSPVGTIAATDVQAAIAEVASEASSVGDLDDLTDVTITAPEANQQLQYIGGVWVNNHRRWEPVTTNPGAGPEIVFDGDEIVMTWADYS
jgi:flagellar hook-basal body complex protein FliE